MYRYILRRLLVMPVVLLGVSFLTFSMLHLAPGNPAQIIAGPDAPQEVVAQIERELGLDKPIYVQYWNYLSGALRGDLGRSIRTKKPVAEEVLAALPNTIELAVAAMLIAPTIAIPIGVLSAARRASWVDASAMFGALLGISMPVFARGLILMWLLAFSLGLFPISGRGGPFWTPDGLRHVFLPAVTLAIGLIAVLARLTRSAMLEVLNQDYIRTARAKGLAERVVIFRHALKNAMLPVVTVLGLQLAGLLGGAVVTETIFSWPGVGRLAVDAIRTRDFPVVQGAVLVTSLTFVFVNLIVDVLYAYLDPRIRYD
ncbi:MAG: peptide ABC transporter permease [Chloroflexota bacterium]